MPSLLLYVFAKQNFQRVRSAEAVEVSKGSQAPFAKEESERFVAVLNRLHGPCARMTFHIAVERHFIKRETDLHETWMENPSLYVEALRLRKSVQLLPIASQIFVSVIAEI